MLHERGRNVGCGCGWRWRGCVVVLVIMMDDGGCEVMMVVAVWCRVAVSMELYWCYSIELCWCRLRISYVRGGGMLVAAVDGGGDGDVEGRRWWCGRRAVMSVDKWI
ncbi:hypothetical protein ACFE04_030804 [Oxalis oulophora]